MLSVVLSLTCIVSLLTYAYFSIAQFGKILPFTTNNVLIVIAHPDDECMFFGPTLTSLSTLTKAKVHVLCLSTGNADGLGALRKKELVKSCQILGVPASRVKSLDHPGLQDGMKNKWDLTIVSQSIGEYAVKQKIDTVITFDGQGVSGHANHIAAYHGSKLYAAKHGLRLYRLETIPLVRKYIGILDLMIPNYGQKERVTFVSTPISYLITHKAMRHHESQLVWFRWLYVTFSRYMFVNDLIMEC
ncbi:putative N-acetylglucosaminyl-phosphatidylinositol deacetylase [Mucor mucedo]|uniref:putative N-acetylglucosaminyl-phosphatidylinositol deacetylase n=1 Tax=Mucor mucedo TaxID=29922 RepID=UPI00221FF30A|nr:putative N-acetylglucosaminyl-phosphatidylinositol deacetylase [Mucor mucedo]KAI7890954.1 putative N-acetylglucosaminyl-phosphatidylinositol deacetylase [Mucor mucedo]